MPQPSSELILKLLAEKAALRKKVSQRTADAFTVLKNTLQLLKEELQPLVEKIDRDILIDYKDKGEFEAEFSISEDTVIFLMHSNVFTFDHSHPMWKTSYIQDDPTRSFCGQIYVYNFLADSFKYHRNKDLGYLIARIFINSENHFFVEGKRQLGFLYNDFANTELTVEQIRAVIDSAVLYSLDFNPYVTPYENIAELSVQEIIDSTLQAKIATGKRLGFRFSADSGSL